MLCRASLLKSFICLPSLFMKEPWQQSISPTGWENYHMNLETSQGPSLGIRYPSIFPEILTMIPTEEEKQKIQEALWPTLRVPWAAQSSSPDTLLHQASSPARLHLWAFKMDYETTEKPSTW